MHDTQVHVPTKPIDKGINTERATAVAEGDRGGEAASMG